MECAASVRITQWVRGCYEVVVTAVGWPFSIGEVTRCVFLEEPVKESGIINSMDKAAVALPPIREGGTCRTILSRTQSQRSRCEASAVVVGLYECSPFRFNTLGCIVQVWSIHKRRGSRVHFSFCTVPCTTNTSNTNLYKLYAKPCWWCCLRVPSTDPYYVRFHGIGSAP